MPTDWKIRARGHACHKTERSFEDQEDFITRLRMEKGEFIREDFALDAWDDSMKDGSLSVWQSTYIKPPPPDEEPLKKENVEQTLRRLIEGDDPDDRNSIFILAMQLERKRLLVERAVTRKPDGLKIRVYEHRKSGETFIVPDPETPLEEIPTVTENVAIRLGWIQVEADAEPEAQAESETDTEVPDGEGATESTQTSPSTEEALDPSEVPQTDGVCDSSDPVTGEEAKQSVEQHTQEEVST